MAYKIVAQKDDTTVRSERKSLLIAAAKASNAAGLEAKFVTLGKVGHHFAIDMETRRQATASDFFKAP